ncbi:MAG: hypothetical protein IH950_16320 [Bacteroidetes bacterium]|nr:hypothetical protein [Bacteroidota bacterium]
MFKSIIKPPIFCYSITSQTLATTVSATPQINVSNDSDFILTHILGIVETDGIPDASVTLTLSLASGELFSNVALDILAFSKVIIDVAGAQHVNGTPIVLRQPVRIPANSQINVQLTNNTADNVVVQIQLWGYKIDADERFFNV